MKRYCFVALLLILLCFESIYAQEETKRFYAINHLIEKAIAYRDSGDYDSTLLSLNRAKELSEAFQMKTLSARIDNETGVSFMYMARYDDALNHLQKSLKQYEEVKDSAGIAECLNNIGSIQYSQQDFNSALNSYRASLLLRKQNKLYNLVAVSNNNIGLCLRKLGMLDSSIYYHQMSLDYWKAHQNVSGIGVTLNHLGNCYMAQGDSIQALNTLLSAYHLYDSLAYDPLNKLFLSIDIGLLYFNTGQYKLAEQWCSKAYSSALEMNNIINHKNACECLYQVYSHTNRPKEALQYFTEFTQIDDSLSGQKMSRDLMRIELNYAFEKNKLRDSLQYAAEKQLQVERFQRQRISLLSIAALFILAGIYAYSFYRGKRRSDALLLNILPKRVAQELKENKEVQTKHYESVSVLFTDFVDFTRISSMAAADDVVAELNACFTAFDKIVDAAGIEKIKTIGDSYMAAGGLPETNTHHAADVLKVAVEIISFMKNRNSNRKEKGLFCFDLRIGIHSGPVIAGIVGYKKFAYDIWGDTVNTARRMESNGAPGRINISEATHSLLPYDYEFEYRGEVDTKGLGKIKMYFVINES
ncbi:MAG TPA: adenylate/guanylate cyclase domain-containing protein [Bacteroidia bacterium]|nr:adenylate/guanylate cyclase domain-containing protein [Bacteroidia bacterium]HNT80829.1 adenylate/guanylate cyclase domain-containing protein [Bacteroidia bacterium]